MAGILKVTPWKMPPMDPLRAKDAEIAELILKVKSLNVELSATRQQNNLLRENAGLLRDTLKQRNKLIAGLRNRFPSNKEGGK